MRNKNFADAYGISLSKSPLSATASALNNRFETIAGPILNEMTRRPEMVKQTDQIIGNANKETKMFYAGCEYGHARGFDAGYGKGMAIGILGVLLVLGMTQKQ